VNYSHIKQIINSKLELNLMESLPQAVVALASARDHYQLPLALYEGGFLQTLVTEMYWHADKKWFSGSLGAMLSPETLAKRYCPGLDSQRVRLSGKAFGLTALMKALRTTKLNRYVDKALSRKAGLIALEKAAALFCYSYYAADAFKMARGILPHRLLFQLHPHPQSVRAILQDELIRVPQARASLMSEHELSLSQTELDDFANEPHLANGWVVASRYTAQTLFEHGIPAAGVHIVPYGVDCSAFEKRIASPDADQPFTVLFVGSLSQRKGLSYLLEAVRLLKSKSLRVLLCGRGTIDAKLLETYSDINIEIKIGLSRSALVRQMHSADLFILPSLAEGFAHVILEAMACGLPVLATPHTCAPDLIENERQGFIVPIRNAEAIAERIVWGIDHRSELAEMGEAAHLRAQLFTWERFRIGIRNAYAKMVTTQM
jgi:glycosyltransferase involved in cell wall biosynthesis